MERYSEIFGGGRNSAEFAAAHDEAALLRVRSYAHLLVALVGTTVDVLGVKREAVAQIIAKIAAEIESVEHFVVRKIVKEDFFDALDVDEIAKGEVGAEDVAGWVLDGVEPALRAVGEAADDQ